MDEKFFEAFCTRDGVRVLGRRLQPFSLWHAAVLELLESPFVGAERARSIAELVIAVEVCAMRPEGDRLRVPRIASGWWGRVRFLFRSWWWGSRMAEEVAKFYTYLGEHGAGPRFFDSPGGAVKTPWALYLVCRLVSQGVGIAEAWAMSPGRAKWYSAGLCEAAGGEPNILSGADMKAMKEAGYDV